MSSGAPNRRPNWIRVDFQLKLPCHIVFGSGMAADGVQTREIVDELKREFPKLRYEAQLYAVRPMLV